MCKVKHVVIKNNNNYKTIYILEVFIGLYDVHLLLMLHHTIIYHILSSYKYSRRRYDGFNYTYITAAAC